MSEAPWKFCTLDIQMHLWRETRSEAKRLGGGSPPLCSCVGFRKWGCRWVSIQSTILYGASKHCLHRSLRVGVVGSYECPWVLGTQVLLRTGKILTTEHPSPWISFSVLDGCIWRLCSAVPGGHWVLGRCLFCVGYGEACVGE